VHKLNDKVQKKYIRVSLGTNPELSKKSGCLSVQLLPPYKPRNANSDPTLPNDSEVRRELFEILNWGIRLYIYNDKRS